MTTTLAFSALVFLLIRRVLGQRLDIVKAGMLFVLILVVVFLLRIESLAIAGYLKGAFGDISSLSTAALLWFCFGSYWTAIQSDSWKAFDLQPLFIPLALVSMVFFPLTLGLSRWDPYSLGYQPLVPTLALALFGIGLVYCRKYLAAFFLAIVLVAYLFHLQESDNLWDYLFDPVLAVVLWIWLLKRLVARIRSSRLSSAQ